MNVPIKRKRRRIFKFCALPTKATPSGPIGSAFGVRKLNPGEACKIFNAMTVDCDPTMPVIAVVEVLEGVGKFTITSKKPSVSLLLKKAANISSGSQKPRQNMVGKITMAKVTEIAKYKQQDMNSRSLEAAVKMILGTARSIGIEVEDESL